MFLPKLLGANPKTFLIAGAILLGSPVWFFLAMIGPVNLILLGLDRPPQAAGGAGWPHELSRR